MISSKNSIKINTCEESTHQDKRGTRCRPNDQRWFVQPGRDASGTDWHHHWTRTGFPWQPSPRSSHRPPRIATSLAVRGRWERTPRRYPWDTKLRCEADISEARRGAARPQLFAVQHPTPPRVRQHWCWPSIRPWRDATRQRWLSCGARTSRRTERTQSAPENTGERGKGLRRKEMLLATREKHDPTIRSVGRHSQSKQERDKDGVRRRERECGLI